LLTKESITNARDSSKENVVTSRKQSTSTRIIQDTTVDYTTCNAARLLGKIAQGKGNQNGNMTTQGTRRKSNNSSTTWLQQSNRNNNDSDEEEEDENKDAKNGNNNDEENGDDDDEQNGNDNEEENVNDNDQVSNSGFSNEVMRNNIIAIQKMLNETIARKEKMVTTDNTIRSHYMKRN